ncbi:MAG: LbFV-ORF92-like primase/helicase [Cotesia congregata filamentous virus 2]
MTDTTTDIGVQVCTLWPKRFPNEKKIILQTEWINFINNIVSTVNLFQNYNDSVLVNKFLKCMSSMFGDVDNNNYSRRMSRRNDLNNDNPEKDNDGDINMIIDKDGGDNDSQGDGNNVMSDTSSSLDNSLLSIVGMNAKSLMPINNIPVWQWRFFSELLFHVWKKIQNPSHFECGLIYQIDKSTFPFLRLIIDVDYKYKSTQPETFDVYKSLLGIRRGFIRKLESDVESFFQDKSDITFMYTSKKNKLSFHLYCNIYVDKATYFQLHVYLMNLYKNDDYFKIDMVTGISMPFVRGHLLFNPSDDKFIDNDSIDYEMWSNLNVFNIDDCWNNIYILSHNDNMINDTLSTTKYVLDTTNQIVNEISELSTNESVTNHTLLTFKLSHSLINIKKILIFIKKSVAHNIICKSNTIQRLNFGHISNNLIKTLNEWSVFTMESLVLSSSDSDNIQLNNDDIEMINNNVDIIFNSPNNNNSVIENTEDRIDQTHFYNILNYTRKVKKNNMFDNDTDTTEEQTDILGRLTKGHIPKSVKNIQRNVHFSDSCRFPFSEFQLNLLTAIENNKLHNPNNIMSLWNIKNEILLEMLKKLDTIDMFYLPTLFLLQPIDQTNRILKIPSSFFIKYYFPKTYLNNLIAKNSKNPAIGIILSIIEKHDNEIELQYSQTNKPWYEQQMYIDLFGRIIENIFNIGNVSAMIACIALNNQTYNHMEDVILFILYNFNLSLHAKYILTKWYEVNVNNFREHFVEGTAFNNNDFLLFSVIQLNGIEKKPYTYRSESTGMFYKLVEKQLKYSFLSAKTLFNVSMQLIEKSINISFNLSKDDTILMYHFNAFVYFFITHALGAKNINDKMVLIFSEGCWRDMTKHTLDGDFPTMKNINIAPIHTPETSSFCYEWAHTQIGLYNTSFQVFELNTPSWKNRVYIKQPVSTNINGWQLSYAPELNNYILKTFMGAFHFMKQIHLDVLTVSLLNPIIPIEIPNEMLLLNFIKLYKKSRVIKKIINKRFDAIVDDLYINVYHKITLDDFSRVPLKIWPQTTTNEIFHYNDTYDPRIVQCWLDDFKVVFINNINDYPMFKKLFNNVLIFLYLLKINPILPIHVLLKKIFCNERKHANLNLCYGGEHKETFQTILNDICDTLKNVSTMDDNNTTNVHRQIDIAFENNSDNIITDRHYGGSNNGIVSETYGDNHNVILTRMEYNIMNSWYYNSIPRLYDNNQELSCFLADKILKHQINNSNLNNECNNMNYPSTTNTNDNNDDDMIDKDNNDTVINNITKFHCLLEKYKKCKINKIQDLLNTTLPQQNDLIDNNNTTANTIEDGGVGVMNTSNTANNTDDLESLSSNLSINNDTNVVSHNDIEKYFSHIKEKRKHVLSFTRNKIKDSLNIVSKQQNWSNINLNKIDEIFLRFALLFTSWLIRMGDLHDFSNCNFFKDIRFNRRKLYLELRNFIYVINGEPLQYKNTTEYVKKFETFMDSYDFIPNDKFTKTPLMPLDLDDNNISFLHNSAMSCVDSPVVKATIEMESNIVNMLINIYKNEIFKVFTSYMAFAEYHPHVFIDIIKYLMTAMFKGNVTRQYMFIVGVTGCGKSTLIQALQQLFRGLHSCLLHGHAFDKHTKADVLDPSAEKIASSLLCVTDEVINPDCTRLNTLCSDGESSSRAIHANITSQFKISASLLLAGNKGFMINDATEDRILYIHKDFLLSKYLLCHDSYIDETIIIDNCPEKRAKRLLKKFQNSINIDNFKSDNNKTNNNNRQIGEIVTTSNFAGLQFIKRSLPYLFSFPVCGQYITFMYGKLIFYNSYTLPISKDLTPTSMRYKYEFSKANNPVQRFLSTFIIDTNYAGVTPRHEFHDIVFGWWNQVKRQCLYQNPGDFNGSSLVTLLEHRLNKYRSPDGGYKFKILLK